MRCYAMLYYAMLCDAMRCYAMLCDAMICYEWTASHIGASLEPFHPTNSVYRYSGVRIVNPMYLKSERSTLWMHESMYSAPCSRGQRGYVERA